MCTLQLTCCFVQNWARFESEKPAFLGSPGDADYMLRRAAIVTQQTLHVFDLDANPPACKVFSHLPSTYKVRVDVAGQCKTTSVKTAAWSLVLGKDPLPKALLFSRLYARSSIVVMFREGGSLNIFSQHPDITLPLDCSIHRLMQTGFPSHLGLLSMCKINCQARRGSLLVGLACLPSLLSGAGPPPSKLVSCIFTPARESCLCESLYWPGLCGQCTSTTVRANLLQQCLMHVLTRPFYYYDWSCHWCIQLGNTMC